jgi:parallel beta-helix repeat protein
VISKYLQNAAAICLLGLATGFQIGCSVAEGPVENLGVNPINSGSLTWYVSGTGTDYGDGTTPSTAFRSIQKGISTAICGDLIYVMNGTYSAAGSYSIVDVKNTCTAASPLKIRAYPGATPTLLNTGNSTTTANWDMVYIEQTAAYIEINGLTITGNNAYVTLATAKQYQSSPGTHPELNGNCIGVVGGGTAATAPNHISILNNIVSMCPGGGISTKSADYITISGNTVFNNSWYSAYGTSGISILASYDTNPSDTATKYKTMVTGNTVYGNQEFIPYVSVGTITDGEGIILDSNNNSAYSGGNISYAPYTGRMLIANNVLYSNGSSAIEVFQTSHADVVNNSTYGNLITTSLAGRGELFLNYATDVINYNNLYVSSASQSPVDTNQCTTCTLDYNIYFGGTNNFSSGTSSGSHDLTADPLYGNKTVATPGSVSLKLQSGSPALASGTATLAPTTDILGNPRPNASGKYDRGAYQQ